MLVLLHVGDESRSKFPHLFNAILTKPIKQAQLKAIAQAELKQDANKLKPELISNNFLAPEFSQKFLLSILIAEDNLIIQKLAIRVLTKLGYDTKIANNGREAVDMSETGAYQVILMDMLKPEMDGIEATRLIRMRNIYQPAIIAMTANVLPEDKEICYKAGMDGFISKPFKLKDLTNILKKISGDLTCL